MQEEPFLSQAKGTDRFAADLFASIESRYGFLAARVVNDLGLLRVSADLPDTVYFSYDRWPQCEEDDDSLYLYVESGGDNS